MPPPPWSLAIWSLWEHACDVQFEQAQVNHRKVRQVLWTVCGVFGSPAVNSWHSVDGNVGLSWADNKVGTNKLFQYVNNFTLKLFEANIPYFFNTKGFVITDHGTVTPVLDKLLQGGGEASKEKRECCYEQSCVEVLSGQRASSRQCCCTGQHEGPQLLSPGNRAVPEIVLGKLHFSRPPTPTPEPLLVSGQTSVPNMNIT